MVSYLIAKRSGLAVGSIEAINLLGRVTSALIRQKFPTGRGYLIQQESMILAQFARIGNESEFARLLAEKWQEEVPLTALLDSNVPANTTDSENERNRQMGTPPLMTELLTTPATDFHSILDEPFDADAEMEAMMEYLKQYNSNERIPDIQDVLAESEQQSQKDTEGDDTEQQNQRDVEGDDTE